MTTPGRRDPDRQDAARRGRSRRRRARSARRGQRSRQADEQHRPRERRARLDDLAVAARAAPRTRAWTSGSGARACCPRSLQVGAAGHVQPAPQRLARDRHEQVAGARRAPSRRPCARGRARARAPRSRVASSNSPSANGRFSAFMTRYSRFGAWRFSHSAWMRGSSRSMPTTRRRARRCAHWCVEHALAAADVEQRLRGGACANSSSSVRSKPAISRRDDRVGRAVLVVGVAGDRALRSTVTVGLIRPQRLALLGLARSPAPGARRRWWRRARRRAGPARSATAATPSCSSMRRTRSKVALGHHPLARTSRSPMHAERAEHASRR